MNCELLDLRAFLAVLDLRSFVKSAQLLNLSQPALSRRIQALEAAFGAPLLERTTRSVTPTALGRELEPMIRRLLGEFEASVLSINALGARQRGQVAIACIPTAAFYFLPRVIRTFRERYPLDPLPHPRPLRQRWPRERDPRRGRVRHQLHGCLERRARLHAAHRGSVRPGLPPGRPAGRQRPADLARPGGPAAHRGEPHQRQPAASRRRSRQDAVRLELALRGPSPHHLARASWRRGSAPRSCRGWRRRPRPTRSSSRGRSAIPR